MRMPCLYFEDKKKKKKHVCHHSSIWTILVLESDLERAILQKESETEALEFSLEQLLVFVSSTAFGDQL